MRDLDPATFAALPALLDQALDLPEAERVAWVEGLPPEHDELKPDVVAGTAVLGPFSPFEVDRSRATTRFLVLETAAVRLAPALPGPVVVPGWTRLLGER